MHEVRQYNTKIRLLDELITFECTIKVKIYWRGIKMWHFRFNEMLSIGKWRGWQECVCVCRILRHPRNQITRKIIRISTSKPANQIEICQYCVRLLFINLLCISCACGLVDRFYSLIARLLVRRLLLPFIFIKFRCAFRVTIHVSRIPFSFVYRFNFWSFKSQTHTDTQFIGLQWFVAMCAFFHSDAC